jgi:hypothetical protein
MSIRDTRLLVKAIMQRWPITPKMREGIIGTLARVLTDDNASHREKTAAARALMAADAQNIEMEKMEQADEHEHRARLVAIAKHLGPERMSELAARTGRTLAIEGPDESESDGTGQAGRVPEDQKGET